MRVNFWSAFIPVLLCLMFSEALYNAGSAKIEKESTNVLFIGNSYTYYHSMPQLFRAMAEHRFPGDTIETHFIGHGGATLKQQWEEGRALEEIRSGRWDYVILQEQSMLGREIIEDGKSYVRSPDLFFEYSRRFNREVRKNGAEPVFYMTWSRRDYPDQQKYLTYAYMSIARQTGSKIAPAGVAWDKLRTDFAFNLYENDGSHPAIQGAYTAALMLFAVIFDTDPIGIPGRLEGFEILRGGKISAEKSLLCNLTNSEAKIIQKSVSDIFQQLKKRNGYLDVEVAISDKKPSTFTKSLEYLSDARRQVLVLIALAGIILIIKGGFLLFKR